MYTLEEVVDSALKAVGEKGADYVYDNEDCAYSTVDESEYYVPSCLVGWVMSDLDPILFREIASPEYNMYALKYLLETGAMPDEWATPEAMKFLMIVQSHQDTLEDTWLEAINKTLEEMGVTK